MNRISQTNCYFYVILAITDIQGKTPKDRLQKSPPNRQDQRYIIQIEPLMFSGSIPIHIHFPNPYPKLSYIIFSVSTPRESRYSVTVFMSIGGPQR